MMSYPARDEGVYLTPAGREALSDYTDYLACLRDAIVGDGPCEAGDMSLPTEDDVVCDIRWLGWDEDGDYLDCWSVADGCDADEPLALRFGRDFVCM